MTISESYLETTFFFCLILLLCYYYLRRMLPAKQSCAPTNFPIIRMLPATVRNIHRAHDYITEVLDEVGGTFIYKGPLFANIDMVFTSDPANIHHIMSKNFSNYPKGPEFMEMYEIFGNGIFNVDSPLWEIHRKITMSMINNPNFHRVLEQNTRQKLEESLLPVLDSFAKREAGIDLQDIFQRFTFDSITKLLLNHDTCSLSLDLPYIPCEKAFNHTAEALLYRHVLPGNIRKLLKWLRIGTERNLSRAWVAFDQFIYPCLTSKKKQNPGSFDCLKAFTEAYKEKAQEFGGDSNLFLRDVFLNLMFAGRDTTSSALTWFFWLISRNPTEENKIMNEIITKLNIKKDEKRKIFNIEETSKLIYLHGALNEALRLFPPVALEHKTSVQPDVLPSGLGISSNTKLVLSFYSVGRMKSIWGKDCMEFKPGRWITDGGRIKHEASFKFPAFNAGPRTCVGKEMAFIQMKMVAATVIYNYQIQAMEDQAQTRVSIILQMKHGFPAKLFKRN